MITRDRLYINGQWLPSESGETLEVISPATGEVIGIVPNGTTADADRAVDAACAAFPAWSATPVSARAEALRALAEGLADWAEEIATTVTQEVGTPIERGRRSGEFIHVGAAPGWPSGSGTCWSARACSAP